MKNIYLGLLFAILWGSGSVATKLGIQDGQPMVLINLRFIFAAILILTYALLIKKERLPKDREWINLLLCGLLSMAIYPTSFVFAMKNVTAGIGTLASATCPLIISVMNAVFLNRKISKNIWLGLFVGLLGIIVAIYPLLAHAHATFHGVLLLSFSMICYSVGTVFYQSKEWNLSKLSINGWMILFGSVFLAPFTSYLFESSANTMTSTFFISLLWLTIPISIFASQIWLYILKEDPLRASFWLYLCPIFGFLLSSLFTGEPITYFTVLGTVLVLLGLYLGKKEEKTSN
jgi:probable blue pigment (indigoidine) exporter